MEERLAKILTGPQNPNPVTLTRKFGVVHPYRPQCIPMAYLESMHVGIILSMHQLDLILIAT